MPEPIKLLSKGFVFSNSLNRFNGQDEAKRTKHFQKLYDYYMGARDDIIEHMKIAMRVMFKERTLNKMLLPYVDIVKKVIDRTSLAYKDPAERYIETEEKVTEDGKEIVKRTQKNKQNETYQELLSGSNINTKAKTWNRLAKLLDTVYVAPMWRQEHIEYDIFPPHLICVTPKLDNYLEPAEVLYERVSGETTEKVYWSDTQNIVIDGDDRPVKQGENPNGVNPYGILPFVPCRLRETENHWGEGDTQLVELAEKSSILLASTYYNAIMQSHGQPVGINLGIPEGQDLQTGPDTVVQAEHQDKNLAPPSFTFVQPNPATESCLKQIDWMIKTAAVMRGLTADSVSIDSKAQSGAAKIMDNFELMELRENDIEALRLFEKKLFEVTVAVWNYHNPGKKIDPKANLICDFAAIEAPVSEKDDLEAKQKKYELGLWTPVDDLIDEDEGVDEAKAIETVMKNLEKKKMFGAVNAPVVQGDTQLAKDLGERMNQLSGSLAIEPDMSMGEEE